MAQFSVEIICLTGSLPGGNQQLWTYNEDRPNMGIRGMTPVQKLKMAA